MRIDGRALADDILAKLHVSGTPTLAVVLVGDNPESLAYIRQKKMATEKIGGRFIFEHLPLTTTQKELTARVDMFNNDPQVHGLIVQRPLPNNLTAVVAPAKDVDGFEADSPFEIPIVMAIKKILEDVDTNNKNIVIIGRGDTAGKPIAQAFPAATIIHSQTPNPHEMIKTADILISCVGKHVVDAVKPGAIAISVGIWRDTEGKLHGDYEEDAVKNVASFYTPTPGGIGPVNIACLMQNIILAAQKMTH